MLLQLDFHNNNNINSNNADDDIDDNDNYNTTNSKKHQQGWFNHVNDMEVCDLVLTSFWHIYVHPTVCKNGQPPQGGGGYSL